MNLNESERVYKHERKYEYGRKCWYELDSESEWEFNYEYKLSLNSISRLSISWYANISMRISFKGNLSGDKKINANLIASVSKCEYWYEFKRESEWGCEYEFDYGFECSVQANIWLWVSKGMNVTVSPTEIINMKMNE